MLATVDCVIEVPGGIVLVRRKHPPEGWALPGGFVEDHESSEEAAVREAAEETGLAVRLSGLLGVYSGPNRDPRGATLTVVYIAQADGEPQGGDDAAVAAVFDPRALPRPMAFDHERIVSDYLAHKGKTRSAQVRTVAAAAGLVGVAAALQSFAGRRKA